MDRELGVTASYIDFFRSIILSIRILVTRNKIIFYPVVVVVQNKNKFDATNIQYCVNHIEMEINDIVKHLSGNAIVFEYIQNIITIETGGDFQFQSSSNV